jgi:dephospho-CoA kinase
VTVIGLTGGMASGKSLVAGMFRALGAHVVDADQIAREVVAQGSEALREIATQFGQAVIAADGSLDRAAMARRIFSDPAARTALNAIMHPRIRARIAARLRDLRAEAPGAVVVVDIPLLLDAATPEAYGLDGVVVVFVDEATQLRRLMARDALSAGAARDRLASQRPLREKLAEATWVIDNTGTAEGTRAQVEALWQRWQAQAPRPTD